MQNEHNIPTCTQNTSLPVQGINFDTVTDPDLLEAMAILDDCAVALAAFEAELAESE